MSNEDKQLSAMGYTFKSTKIEKNIKNYSTLTKIYGSLLNDNLLKKMEKSQFLDCMTNNESKGWTLIK